MPGRRSIRAGLPHLHLPGLSAGHRHDLLCAGDLVRLGKGRASVSERPFPVPDDPPIPPAVLVDRFVHVRSGSLPAVLIQRDDFGDASLYELVTAVGPSVEPVTLVPGGSPLLLLSGSSLYQGSGFSCSAGSDGSPDEVITQYDWYVVDPTDTTTAPDGSLAGDPAVYLQTTTYSASSSSTFISNTLPISTVGYTSIRTLTGETC